MNAANDLAIDGTVDDLFDGWFEQSELMAVPEADLNEEMSHHRSRVAVVVAAISATALTLVIVFGGRV